MRGKRNSAKRSALRLIHMILSVPTEGESSTTQIHQTLTAAGYRISKVQVCRDLKSCAAEFGITKVRGGFGRDYLWNRRRLME